MIGESWEQCHFRFNDATGSQSSKVFTPKKIVVMFSYSSVVVISSCFGKITNAHRQVPCQVDGSMPCVTGHFFDESIVY